MKLYKLFTLLILAGTLTLVGCDDNDNGEIEPPVPEDAFFTQADQIGRPAITTVFVSSGNKDAFNTTVPNNMESAYQQAFEDKLLALNPDYSQNALGQDAATFTTLLSNDVLNVATSGTTTFFDGENVLTGRQLSDDVIDVELLLIFGGPDGSEKPELTSDNVDSNDKEFMNSFPYLAEPHQ